MKNLIKGIVVSLFVLKLSKHPFKVPTSTITCSKSKVEVLELRLNLVYKMQPPFLISTFKYVLVSRRYVRRWADNLTTQEKKKNREQHLDTSF